MINLIKVDALFPQNVEISSLQKPQEIIVKNENNQTVAVRSNDNLQDIKISGMDYLQSIKISNDCCNSSSNNYQFYEGDYEATPKTTPQIMPTAEKIMQKDFTVKAIPYSKTPNNKGGNTISIG